MEKGDRVLTTAGVVGKVVEIEEKDGFSLVTIETGTAKHKGYLTLDVYAIAENLSKPMQLANNQKEETPKDAEVVEENEPTKDEVKEEAVQTEEQIEAPVEQEVTEEKPQKTRKSKK